MADAVTLDAMIHRDDFAVIGPPLNSAEPIRTLSIENVTSSGMLVPLLRKPDFQRETNHWSPYQVVTFLESFLDNELIPSLILWQSQSYVFVIDGGHRLSALRAWIEDDYGDGAISRKYFGNEISRSQLGIAKKTRELVNSRIGSYRDIKDALVNPDVYTEDKVQRSRNMATRSLSLQWVNGDAAKAESSFFKINTQGTPLDKTEETILKNRYRSVAIAARSIVRAATGHKYWSKFELDVKDKIEKNAVLIHHALFNPEVDTPIKTLDLPVGGAKSPISALEMLMGLICITNAPQGKFQKSLEEFSEDEDGSGTVQVLIDCARVVGRASDTLPGSLGLHPAVYFYSERGRHIPDLLLGMLLLIRKKLQENDKEFFRKFTDSRAILEDYLVENKSLITQSLQLSRSAVRFIRVSEMFEYLIDAFYDKKEFSHEDLIKVISPNSVAKILAIAEKPTSTKFSTDAKSAIFIRQALSSAIRCPICHGYVDASKSGSYDHVVRVEDGGGGSSGNGQITHPYCNTAVKC
ncbi:DUF262 domain-containing protein [Ciceribacter azotifigens]|uniref:DUF262 domain-containing protein n=1 Tax=Ciceribacter azotifigens TaxID=2069303 RepID=UPI003A83BC0B